MTKEQRRLVSESFSNLAHSADYEAVITLFYGRLFDLDPSLRHLFRSDLRSQSAKLAAMLGMLVEGLEEFEGMRPQLRELGLHHVRKGVKPEQYETLTQALLWAFGHAIERGFDSEVRAAWTQVLREISAEMVEGARDNLCSTGVTL